MVADCQDPYMVTMPFDVGLHSIWLNIFRRLRIIVRCTKVMTVPLRFVVTTYVGQLHKSCVYVPVNLACHHTKIVWYVHA